MSTETETDSPFVTNMDLFLHKDNHKIIVNTDDSYYVTAITPDQGISVQGFSPDEIKDSQAKDPDLKFILDWLQNKKTPSESALFLASPAAKSFWINKDMFFLDDHGILKNIPKKQENQTRLVVPISLRETVLQLNHELPSAGHQGTERTMAKIKVKYHWYNMSRDIRNFVLTCDVCSKHKKTIETC